VRADQMGRRERVTLRALAYKSLRVAGLSDFEIRGLACMSKQMIEPLPVWNTPVSFHKGLMIPDVAGGAITTYDGLVAALTGGKGQDRFFQLPSPSVAAGQFFSLWLIPTSNRIPVAGGNGGASAARAVDSTITGAITFTNPGGTDKTYLTTMSASAVGAGAGGGGLMLVDRLLDYNFSTASAATVTLTNTATLPSRDANGAALGDGVMMFYEVSTALGSGAATLNTTYTNQAGTGSKTTGAISICSQQCTVGRIPFGFRFMPLASGDTGVRSVQSVAIATGTTTGAVNLVLCRPLGYLPLAGIVSTPQERDTVAQINRLPRLYDSSALQWLMVASSGTAGVLDGMVSAVQG
jgi:hypothetical protein